MKKKTEKKKITHDDIPVFPHETRDIDGDLWIRLRCVVLCDCDECQKNHKCNE